MAVLGAKDPTRVLKMLIARRQGLGWSVNQAATASKDNEVFPAISQSQWDRFERGTREPNWSHLFGMAEALGRDIKIQID